VLSVNYPCCDEPNQGANQDILPMVMIVRCPADGDAGGGEEAGEEEEQVERGGRRSTPECSKLASEVEEEETPGDKGERGMTRGEALSAFINCG